MIRDYLATAAMPDWPPLPEIVCKDATAYLKRALGLAPFHIRVAIRVLDALFALYALARCNAPDILSDWGHLSSLTATHERLYRSLVMLAVYEHPSVRLHQ